MGGDSAGHAVAVHALSSRKHCLVRVDQAQYALAADMLWLMTQPHEILGSNKNRDLSSDQQLVCIDPFDLMLLSVGLD